MKAHGESRETRSKDNLSHFDKDGRPCMVDVSSKTTTHREAYARGEITMNISTLERIRESGIAKGDVLSTAQVAAIMAVKETGRLIPMAHPLSVTGVDVEFNLLPDKQENPSNKHENPSDKQENPSNKHENPNRQKSRQIEGSVQSDDGVGTLEIGVRVKLAGRTGVEMEALTGVSIAALTVYDMCKAIDKSMVIGNIRLEEKKGGRSGHYKREAHEPETENQTK